METTRPSSPSQSTQATHGTSPTKHRAAHAQGAATAGDFLGMLSALNETLFASPPVLNTTAATDVGDALALETTDDQSTSSKKRFGLLSASGEATLSTSLTPPNPPSSPVLNTTQATVDTSAMVSLLALQAGFSGAIQTPLNTPSTATTTNNVSLEGNNPLMAAVGSRGIAVASSGGELGLVVAQPAISASLAVGSRGVAVASSGGELGLVAQTAALDSAAETLAEQNLASVAPKSPASSRLLNSATDASMARNIVASRQEPLEHTTLQATLASALQAAVSGTSAPHDLATAAAGAQHQSAWGGASPSIQVPVDLLGQNVGFSASNAQGAGRGNEGGRSSSGQNPEAGGLFGVSGTTTELGTVGEAPVFDWTGALPTEDAVAEQVSYWVNQNIQNAELTVEHDGHPVEVTVTLNGNEAHVSFRSDQNETRTLLDASVAQLRDLLENQGLSLSGMTVGDSSSRGNSGSNDGQRQSAKGARQTSVQASTPTERVGPASTVTDKTVDIFV